MLKCLIVYYSMGGTTAKVAESIAAGLRSNGYDCHLHNLKNGPAPELKEYHLLGIGAPVYYFRQPFNIIDYASSLPDLKNLPVFTFNTFGTYQFDAARWFDRILVAKGAIRTGHFACHGTGLFLGYVKLGYLFSPDHPTPEDLSKAEQFGLNLATAIKNNRSIPIDKDHPAPFVYWIERFLTNRWLARQVLSRSFSVNSSACNSCGACIKNCPTHNLTKGDRGQPVWGRNCNLCLMCETKCPRDAIKSMIDWPIFLPFLKFNVRVASRDNALHHVRVKHHQGKTEKL